MNFQSFNLDVESAKKADKEGGRINRTDKFVGTISKFEFIQTAKGTQGFEIEFITDGKEEAKFSIYTTKADGTPIFGRDKINAMMTCCAVKTLTPTKRQIEKYNFDSKGMEWSEGYTAPEIEGKEIGVLLQLEEYENQNGELKTRMNFVSCFQASTGLMAKEILERKTTPELLEKAYARLMKNGDKKLPHSQAQTQGGGYGQTSSTATKDDDDLPF